MVSPAAPSVFFSLAAFVLLLLCSLSTPIIKSIFFLRADVVSTVATASVNGSARFGIFGYCLSNIGVSTSIFNTAFAGQCSPRQLGYTFNPTVLGVTVSISENYDRIFSTLTKVLVLVPISCGLAFMVFLTSLFSLLCNSRFWEIMAFLWALIALVVTWAAWIIEIVAFSIARNRLADYTDDEVRGSFGNALWLHLAAAIVLLLTTLASCCGMCGSFRNRRRERSAIRNGDLYDQQQPMTNSPYAQQQPVAGAPYVQQGWRSKFNRRQPGAAAY